MIIDLDSSRYKVLRPIIECLKFSQLAQALTMAEYVPLVHLSRAYSSSIYNKVDDVIHFEVASHNTSIKKSHFSKLVRLATLEVHVDPESISTSALIQMFYQMRYTMDISLLSKFRKPFLPPI
ncbi:unnamed protein product [Lactuca saligna]|uniref:Uncharacterized protein n=1 Tax=Lactuca saligna TaxID=75948 RepID=A0AA35YLU8_LACSI|nr:unnamed protein product [Lactuca saligna]